MATGKPIVDRQTDPASVGTLPTGDTLLLNASAAAGAPLRLPAGTAPDSPVDGDIVRTSDGLLIREGSAWVGPLGSGFAAPQGRLTLTTATRVMTASITSNTVYYTPYAGRSVPIYSGSLWIMRDLGGELSQALSDTTKSPAAATTDSNYDLFVWDDDGTMRCTRGPAWSSGTSRGTGVGTTELDMTTVFPTNKRAITNGPAANRGTYVGTIHTNGSSTCDWTLGSLAASGGMATLGVWNCYNRRPVETMVRDTANSWTCASGTVQAANNSATMRVNVVVGLKEDPIYASYAAIAQNAASNSSAIGVGLDSTIAFSSNGRAAWNNTASTTRSMVGDTSELVEGFHYFSAVEGAYTSNSATFYGDAGSASQYQNGLLLRGQF